MPLHRLQVEMSGQELVPLQTGGWGQVGTIITVTETGHARVSGQALDLEFTPVADRSRGIQERVLSILATPGRYQMRTWKMNAHHTNTGAADQALLAGMRAYLREDEDFGPVTMIAVQMRATNNLSRQASRKISVLATRKLPVWDGTSWSAPQVTRSTA